jgi:methionyl-tRNA formyltransferase
MSVGGVEPVDHYVYACNRPWGIEAFMAKRAQLPGAWSVISSPADLSLDVLERLKPKYIFFPNWSWRVPAEILGRYECVLFHMTDVPFGRGGSPLQNLIVRGIETTKISAMRMTDELDAGPVYAKAPLDLSGSATEIFERAAGCIVGMIGEMLVNAQAPVAQVGEPVFFDRRKPAQSVMPGDGSLRDIYDHIRMLDAPGYPPAFIKYGHWTIEFSNSRSTSECITADVKIFKTAENKP